MPTSGAEVFAELSSGQPPPAAAPAEGAPPAAPQRGQSGAELFRELEAKAPTPLSTKMKEKAVAAAKVVGAEAKTVGAAVGAAVKQAGVAGLRPYLDDMTKWANDYSDALHEDLKAYPEGTGNQLLRSLKTANDALGYVSGPLMSPIYTGLINPVKAGIAKLGALVQKHASEDIYNAEARREGDRGQQYPKGIDLSIHKADVQHTVEDLQTASEALINAGVAFVGPKSVREAPLERPAAEARVALTDAKVAVEPPAPKLIPISASLDKTAGFGKISDAVAPALKALPNGTKLSAGQVLEQMLPHAEGYAKEFLTKLNEHIDKTVPVTFGERAGMTGANRGAYFPELNSIEVKTTGNADVIHTTVHEMVHAATLHMLDTLLDVDLKAAREAKGAELTGKEKLKVLNNPSNAVIKELDQIIAEARVRARKAGRPNEFYGLTGNLPRKPAGDTGQLAMLRMSPRYEFVAEVFSDTRLQEFLANSEKYASAGYKFKNMLNQLGLMLGKHFGMDKPHELQLLNQSMRVGTQLIKLQAADKPVNRSMVQIVAHSSDTTITRGDMQRATVSIEQLADKQALKRSEGAMRISIEQILRAVSPETLGRNAKLAASVVASRITEQMQKTSAWRHGSDTRLKYFRLRPDSARQFVDKFEAGETFADPTLRDVARRYKEWNARIFDQDRRISGLDYEPRDHYLYHSFEDSEAVANYFTRKYGAKWGDPSFIKDRTFDLYKEAIAAGFRPRFTNPEDIMLARQHASDIAAMHTGILEDLERYGLATRKVEGKEKLIKTIGPDGKVQFNFEKKEKVVQPEDTTRWRAPNGQVFWVDNKANVVLDNAFKSKSLWEDKGLGGTTFRGMMALKNTLVPIRLALSLFHPLHVTGIDIASSWTRAASDMLGGRINPVRAFGQVLRGGLGPIFENPKAGWRVMKVWRGQVAKEALNAADAEALKLMVEGGMIPEMSSQYRTNARQNFMNALRDARADFRQIKPGSFAADAARVTWHAPWALLSALQAPIFEYWIPALKTANYLKDAKSLLAKNPELVEGDATRQMMLRKIAKSADNRYGEMAYNTLFWKRWMKDIAVLNTLSLGWQLGFLREYGGGAMDLGQFVRSGDKMQRIRQGLLDRPIFVATYTALGAGTSGLMTYAMTGEYPEGLDWIDPRTGEKNADGTPQRVSTMFYSREFASLYKHMQNQGVVSGLGELVMNKGSGLFGLMHEWATGVNSFGQEIRNPNSDTFQQLEQTLAYTLSDLEPISMQAMQQNITDSPVKSGVLDALGFTPAPKYLTESKAVAEIKLSFDKYVAPKMTPFDKAQYSQEYHKLQQAYQSGSEDFGPRLDKMTEKYELSAHDQRRIMKSLNSNVPPEVRMFMRLPWQEQKRVLDNATPEERDLFLPHSNKEHVRRSYVPPQQP